MTCASCHKKRKTVDGLCVPCLSRDLEREFIELIEAEIAALVAQFELRYAVHK